MLKKVFIVGWLAVLTCAVAAVFWYNDWKYQLPTPVPVNYKPVANGERIALKSKVPHQSDKPLFLHFYNPHCPCSRFNKKHFRDLVRNYRQDVDFVVVVLSDEKYSVEYIQDKIGLDIPVIFDQTVAEQCGVYSTPQAAIIGTDEKLYYRGNYNASRYCTEEKTAYAKIAIDGLLSSQALQVVNVQAMKSYGCTIPLCKN